MAHIVYDDTRTFVGRLNEKQKSAFPTLYVVPAKSVFADEWDAFDMLGDYVDTYTTWELTKIKGNAYQTILNRFSNEPWSFLQEKKKPRKKRSRRGGRNRNKQQG